MKMIDLLKLTLILSLLIPSACANKSTHSKGNKTSTLKAKSSANSPLAIRSPAAINSSEASHSQSSHSQSSGSQNSGSSVPLIMRTMRPQIKDCYLNGLKKQIDLKGKIVTSFEVDDKGKVVSCGIKQSTLSTSIVDRCICQQILKATFPPSPPHKKVTIVYPFSFSYKD